MEKNTCIILLQQKARELGRLPKKSDFTSAEICLIKAKLGPWNRALEQAELKPISEHYVAKKERVKQKRERKWKISISYCNKSYTIRRRKDNSFNSNS